MGDENMLLKDVAVRGVGLERVGSHFTVRRRRTRTSKIVCAAGALLVMLVKALQPASATAGQTVTPVIPDLSSWLQKKDARPGAAVWQHAAHFSISYETSPAHNIPAPVATTLSDALTLVGNVHCKI